MFSVYNIASVVFMLNCFVFLKSFKEGDFNRAFMSAASAGLALATIFYALAAVIGSLV